MLDSRTVIAYTSALSVLLPLSLLLARGLMRSSPTIRLMLVLLVLSLLSDAASVILFKMKVNSYPVINGFLIIQFFLCLFILFPQGLANSRSGIILASLSGIILVINFFFIQGPWKFNSFSHATTSLVLAASTLVLLASPSRNTGPLYATYLFWFASGILLYMCGNIFVFTFNNFLATDPGGAHSTVWILHNSLNIVKNICFAVGLCCVKKP